jgi:tetratricopeptide (TPR) repeat protein
MNNLNEDDTDIDLIERYHRGLLGGAELEGFLRREKEDKEFARKIRSYTEIIEGIEYYGKQKDFADAVQEWENEAKKKSDPKPAKALSPDPEAGVRTISMYRKHRFWLAAAAAVSIPLLIAYLVFFQKDRPQRLATAYIEQNLTTLSTTMGSQTDSLALAIGAFNEKEYDKAEIMFRSLGRNADLAAETTRYLGITYLNTEQYEKAIQQFNKLISFTDLYSNPGKFYLAITLMKRSKQGDVEQAKELLQEVVTNKLSGYKEASVLIQHL